MTTKISFDRILKFPKADLHRHLDGAMRPEVLLRLAQQTGVKLPTYDLGEFKKIYQITDPSNMPIGELFKRFAWAVAVMRTPNGLYQAAYEQVLDLARENIKYAEVRFAPGYHSIYPAPWYNADEYEIRRLPEMALEHVVGNVLNGLEQGMKETGIEVNLTLCVPRESLGQWGRKSVSDIIELASEFVHDGVVAIDLACDEYTYLPDLFEKAFRSIRPSIRRDPHAGEMGSDEVRLQNIKTCLERLHADGLGHALPIYQSERMMQYVRERNIRIERTPLSPVPGCSLADGHLDELLAYGVPVTIASDDPILMQASLTDNIKAALDYHGFGEEKLHLLIANAVNTGFYRNDAQKKRVQKLFVQGGLKANLSK